MPIGNDWKTTTNYAGLAAENNSLDGKVYYKDGDSYKEVSWETDKPLYSLAADKSWSPADIGSSTAYYYNVNSNKQTFSRVSTKSGNIYYPSSVDFQELTAEDQDLHTDYWYWMTKYFVRNDSVANDITADGGFSRMQMMNYGTATGGLKYLAWVYYYKDGTFNTETPSANHKYTSYRDVGFMGVGAHTGLPDGNTNWWNSSKVSYISVDGHGNGTPHEYRWWTSDVVLDRATYERKTGLNSLNYDNGTTQLGSTVYLAENSNSSASYETAWTGKLYNRNGTGATKLMDKTTGATISGCTPSAINGDKIYNSELYVYKRAPADPPETEQTIITNETGDDGVYTSKELAANGDTYDVTLTAYTTGNEVVTSSQTITPTVKPMDIVMVIDQSGSMATRDMGNTYTAATTPSGGWTVDAATGGKQYYYSPDNGLTYYPVYASTGYIYEKVDSSPRASDMLGNGDDAISLGVNGAPTFYNITTDYYVMYNGEPHKLYLITAGLFLEYGLYPYIYTNNNDAYSNVKKWEANNYWVAVLDPWDGSDLRDDSIWNGLTSRGAASSRISFVNTDGQAIGSTDGNADSARLSYSWFTGSAKISNLYQKSVTKVANQLYYVDAAGNRQNIGEAAQFAGDVVYSGTLYEGSSESRVDALKASVTQFANTVQQNAKEFNVDHRMALVGFAGNKLPAYSLGSDAVTVGSNGLKDYTNTGLFYNGDFENYEKIIGFDRTTDQFINRHYYQNVSGTEGTPVKYSDGWKRLNLTTGATTNTSYSSSNWYKARYEGNGTSLSAADYRAALVSVNNNDALNSNISSAINSFAANGGTYTSYGMTMAEQLYQAVEDAGDTTGVDSEGQTVERQRVIIVFTDGEPGANGYDASIAGEALVSGNLAKTDQDAIVYTVGLFKSAPSSQVADFMKKLSSEHEMTLAPVYGGADNSNYSLGDLDPKKTYYYKNETTGKYYAVTTEYGTGNSLGWWIYNGSGNGETDSYSLTNPKRSTGAGTTVFYNSSGRSVNGEDVKTGTTYFTSNGDKIVYEYRWFDSDRGVRNPALSSGQSTSAGEARYQFYDLSDTTANDDGLSYYMTASNTAELNNVFSQIAGSIVSEEVTVENGSAYTEDTMYVMDEISEDFDLPSDISSSNNHVTVYADTVAEWNADGSPKTYNVSTTPLRQGDLTAIEAGNADVEVVWQGKKLQVNYFDFGRKYMQQSNDDAARIRVVIDGITPNKAGEKLYSNTTQSGLYYKDPDSGAVTLVEPFNRPYISNPGYTVKWVDDEGSNMGDPYDQDVDLIKGDVPAYDGEEPTKDSEETASSYTTYEFDGWSTSEGGAKTVRIERDPESGVVTNYGDFASIVDEDVTYYAHFAPTTVNFVTATWYNGTEELYQQKKVPEGAAPEYAGTMPSKASDHNYTYFFAGWHVGTRYNSDDALSYNAIKDLTGGELTAYLANQGVVTQLDPITSDTDYYAVFAPVMLTTRNYILDFSTKTKLQGDTVTGYDAIYTPGGEFSLEKEAEATSGDFFFTPGMNRNRQYGPSDYYNFTGFSEVNTGVYYENTEKTKVNVIPASSVYFDDDLVNVEAEAEDGSGKNDAIPANTSVNSIDTTETVIMNYTFTGTGIDVYCTTDSESGYVMATLYKLNKDGSRGERVGKAKLMNNKSTTERLNVPTISFTGNESGTYQLELQALKNSHYKLDGIRIYNPVKDQSVYVKDDGTDSTEKNATYQNLRTALITGTSGQVTVSDPESAIISNERVLFVDDITRLDTGATRVVTDEDGKVVYNEDGTPKTEPVYETQFAAYKANSPKNEIYLEKNQAITFQLTEAARAGNHWVGLSAPEKGKNSGTVTVNGNGTPIAVSSAVDMYYPISVGADGSVTITNSGDNMISITNLKITGVDLSAVPVNNAENMEPQMLMMSRTFAPLTMRSVMLAANNGVDPDADDPEPTIEPDDPDDPEPTIEPGDPDDPGPTIEPGDPDDPGPTIEPDDPDDPEPTIEPTPTPTPGQPRQSTIGKLITSIVNSIVKSIKRLFGR